VKTWQISNNFNSSFILRVNHSSEEVSNLPSPILLPIKLRSNLHFANFSQRFMFLRGLKS
ncbi:hypothetical protein H5410_028326, partial [Solanum commersonii]